jgi:uncharacterized protein (UPF0332 family)
MQTDTILVFLVSMMFLDFFVEHTKTQTLTNTHVNSSYEYSHILPYDNLQETEAASSKIDEANGKLLPGG